jgi:aerobic C4-dicarboxylate transport protein
MSKCFSSLYGQVLIAISLGVLVGHFYPQAGIAVKPLGDGFIKLVKMIVGPVIFCTVVTGIAGLKDVKRVGRVGLKAFVYFEIVTTLALAIGWTVVHTFKPGAGMNADVKTLDTANLSSMTAAAKPATLQDFLLGIIPSTPMDAFARGDMLQILLFSLLFGLALAPLAKKADLLVRFIEQCGLALFGVVALLMKLAPIGAFGAMAFTIGKYGLTALLPLAQLMGCFYLTCLLFILGVLGTIARYCGFSILKFIVFIKDELLIVLGTSSSESVLPRLMAKMTQLGCDRAVVGLVVPAGYSFNLDGTAIYLTMAAIFVAQATNTPLSLLQELTLLGVLLLTSKGAAGVTGSGFITLTATLSALPSVPVEGLALIVGIDRFMSEARALTNLIGNGIATLAIARWENQVDTTRLHRELAGGFSAAIDGVDKGRSISCSKSSRWH